MNNNQRPENLVEYRLAGSVATLTMDDGKVNVISLPMQRALHDALDRAEADRAVVILSGRQGYFSAGFDLATLRAGGPDAIAMVRGGFELATRVFGCPLPVVVACTGHAVAMGTFLLCAGDYRIGAGGPYKLTANEVAIGLTVPGPGVEILRSRLTPSAHHRAVALAEVFTPDTAVETGFLDRVVAPEDVLANAQELAASLSKLDLPSHAASKLLVRQSALAAITAAMASDTSASSIVDAATTGRG